MKRVRWCHCRTVNRKKGNQTELHPRANWTARDWTSIAQHELQRNITVLHKGHESPHRTSTREAFNHSSQTSDGVSATGQRNGGTERSVTTGLGAARKRPRWNNSAVSVQLVEHWRCHKAGSNIHRFLNVSDTWQNRLSYTSRYRLRVVWIRELRGNTHFWSWACR